MELKDKRNRFDSNIYTKINDLNWVIDVIRKFNFSLIGAAPRRAETSPLIASPKGERRHKLAQRIEILAFKTKGIVLL